MTTTTFVQFQTPINADWLNDVDASTYQGQLDDGTLNSAIDKFKQSGTGTVVRTVQDKARESVSVLDFYANGVSGVAVDPTGIVDSTLGIQAAMAAAVGKTLLIPPGTYLVDATQLIAVQTDGSHPTPVACCLILPAGGNIAFLGTMGKSIIKAKNGIATGRTNNYWNMFMSNTVDSNVTFDGITFDLNGQNNPVIAGNTAVHQAALFWSGATACCSNLTIKNCVFKNGAGITTIGLSFSIVGNSPSASNFSLKDCQFIDNGFGSNDHTSVYCTANNAIIDRCIFTIPTQAVIVQNAIELHAPYSTVTNCIIANYVGGVDIVSGDTGSADTHAISVNYNKFQCGFDCVFLDRRSTAAGSGMWDIDISENTFEILDVAPPALYAGLVKSCIYAVPNYHFYDLFIRNNTLIKGTYVYQANGIYLGCSESGAFNTNITISDNYIDGFTGGIAMIGTSGTGSTGNLYIHDNKIINSRTATTPAIAGYGCTLGCYATQSITSLYFENNKVLNSQYAGVNVTGTIGTWRYWNNQVDAGSSVGYSNVATITNKFSFSNYVEGTFTPNQGAGLTVVGAFSSAASYTKIGRQVTVVGSVTGATSVAVGTLGAICSNLPYPAVGGYGMGSSTNSVLTATGAVQVEVSTLYSCTAIGATGTIYFSLTYFTTAE